MCFTAFDQAAAELSGDMASQWCSLSQVLHIPMGCWYCWHDACADISVVMLHYSALLQETHALKSRQSASAALFIAYEAVHSTGTPSARHVIRPSTRADTA